MHLSFSLPSKLLPLLHNHPPLRINIEPNEPHIDLLPVPLPLPQHQPRHRPLLLEPALRRLLAVQQRRAPLLRRARAVAPDVVDAEGVVVGIVGLVDEVGWRVPVSGKAKVGEGRRGTYG